MFAASVDPADPGQAAKTEARAVLKDISAMFVGTECVIESYRGQSDWKNSPMAGCVTVVSLTKSISSSKFSSWSSLGIFQGSSQS